MLFILLLVIDRALFPRPQNRSSIHDSKHVKELERIRSELADFKPVERPARTWGKKMHKQASHESDRSEPFTGDDYWWFTALSFFTASSIGMSVRLKYGYYETLLLCLLVRANDKCSVIYLLDCRDQRLLCMVIMSFAWFFCFLKCAAHFSVCNECNVKYSEKQSCWLHWCDRTYYHHTHTEKHRYTCLVKQTCRNTQTHTHARAWCYFFILLLSQQLKKVFQCIIISCFVPDLFLTEFIYFLCWFW